MFTNGEQKNKETNLKHLMIKYVDECYGCDWPTCAGCALSSPIPVYYCDECGRELNERESDLAEYDSYHLCSHCKEDEESEDEE